jgi:hypothetical protein
MYPAHEAATVMVSQTHQFPCVLPRLCGVVHQHNHVIDHIAHWEDTLNKQNQKDFVTPKQNGACQVYDVYTKSCAEIVYYKWVIFYNPLEVNTLTRSVKSSILVQVLSLPWNSLRYEIYMVLIHVLCTLYRFTVFGSLATWGSVNIRCGISLSYVEPRFVRFYIPLSCTMLAS